MHKIKQPSYLFLIFVFLVKSLSISAQNRAENSSQHPILLITNQVNPFTTFFTEILKAEGLNEFDIIELSKINASLLKKYDVVILGEMPISDNQVNHFSNWVNNGGLLIASKPDVKLYKLMGLEPANGKPLSDKYIKIETQKGAGKGLVSESIQYHGVADLYHKKGAKSIATLYSDANTATNYPAITIQKVGKKGGVAVAFSYDLAKSIVYTRQGNPAWAGMERDDMPDNGGPGPIRSNDLFFGPKKGDEQPDWVDFNKIAIPQADEQMRLLTNIILQENLHKKPLPRFWFLPKGLKATVVMTGDDHSNNGTQGRFEQYLKISESNSQEAVDNWTAIRGTSYIFPNTPITEAQALAFEKQGFEIGLHLNTSNCGNYTKTSLENYFNKQLAEFKKSFPSLSPTITHRTHCIVWSDWASKPKVEAALGIRLNTDYYYWPGVWIKNRTGLFTGSGMPMRFADLDGTIIDNYQVVTQIPDESEIEIPGFINELLDNAVGSKGFYGVFCANMHTDINGGLSSKGSDAIISAAKARNVPVISAKQMLNWLDGRNASSFENIVWNKNQLSFNIIAADKTLGINTMLPTILPKGKLKSITKNGESISFKTEIIKGISYAFFDGGTGKYVVFYVKSK